jgi:hypothetical protein
MDQQCVDLDALLAYSHRVATYRVPDLMGDIMVDRIEASHDDQTGAGAGAALERLIDAWIAKCEDGRRRMPRHLDELLHILRYSPRLNEMLSESVRTAFIVRLSGFLDAFHARLEQE